MTRCQAGVENKRETRTGYSDIAVVSGGYCSAVCLALQDRRSNMLANLQGCRRVGVAGEGCLPKGRRYNGMVGWACWGKVHRLKSVLRGADSAAAIWGSLTWVWAQTTIACACLLGIPDELDYFALPRRREAWRRRYGRGV